MKFHTKINQNQILIDKIKKQNKLLKNIKSKTNNNKKK
jgi:hypothetical protein